MAESTDVKVREVSPGFHLIHLPLPMKPTIVNVYLIDGGSEWALIDTGMSTPESRAAFRAALDQAGCRPEQIRKIICTHHHPDHFGTSRPYRELCRAEVFLHPLEQERVANYLPHPRSEETIRFFERNGVPIESFANVPSLGEFWKDTYAPAEPDHDLADRDRIPVGERAIEVVWTPGHAPGHCVLYFRREKVMVVGDHLLPKITPHVGIFSDQAGDPLGDFLASLRKVEALDVETVLPAHGAVYHDHRKRVTQLLEFHEYRMQAMLDLARGRPRTAYDLALEAFDLAPQSPYQQQFPATFETLAHFEHMRRDGRAEKVETNGRIVWRATPAR
ncbi:MAG: MBL fold metallo-hydrolase [Deltaproteobacteria bacterium]|nr:MBL fold metallo-hydrolase [Deltaproteobacteria bacterium]